MTGRDEDEGGGGGGEEEKEGKRGSKVEVYPLTGRR